MSYNKSRYEEYIISDSWKQKKQELFDYYRLISKTICCSECGSQRYLQVHHLTYERLFSELLTDLAVLCRNCHKKAHGLIKETGNVIQCPPRTILSKNIQLSLKAKKRLERKKRLLAERKRKWKRKPIKSVFNCPK
jgi:hypothetical protein